MAQCSVSPRRGRGSGWWPSRASSPVPRGPTSRKTSPSSKNSPGDTRRLSVATAALRTGCGVLVGITQNDGSRGLHFISLASMHNSCFPRWGRTLLFAHLCTCNWRGDARGSRRSSYILVTLPIQCMYLESAAFIVHSLLGRPTHTSLLSRAFFLLLQTHARNGLHLGMYGSVSYMAISVRGRLFVKKQPLQSDSDSTVQTGQPSPKSNKA